MLKVGSWFELGLSLPHTVNSMTLGDELCCRPDDIPVIEIEPLNGISKLTVTSAADIDEPFSRDKYSLVEVDENEVSGHRLLSEENQLLKSVYERGSSLEEGTNTGYNMESVV